jgi:hypothetical protein
VDSTVIPLPGVRTSEGIPCDPIRDPNGTSSWTSSFANIRCYDALKASALLNEIAGKTHTGAPAKIPAVFGIITAKHGESPIDTSQYVADGTDTPATLLASMIPWSE